MDPTTQIKQLQDEALALKIRIVSLEHEKSTLLQTQPPTTTTDPITIPSLEARITALTASLSETETAYQARLSQLQTAESSVAFHRRASETSLRRARDAEKKLARLQTQLERAQREVRDQKTREKRKAISQEVDRLGTEGLSSSPVGARGGREDTEDEMGIKVEKGTAFREREESGEE